jgi:hypothetical protein
MLPSNIENKEGKREWPYGLSINHFPLIKECRFFKCKIVSLVLLTIQFYHHITPLKGQQITVKPLKVSVSTACNRKAIVALWVSCIVIIE